MYEARESYYNAKLDLKSILDLSMACSDSKIYTTWSNLKHSSSTKIMSRHPSGNNNTIPNFLTGTGNLMPSSHKRSLSLPDLAKAVELQRQLNAPLNFSVSSNFFPKLAKEKFVHNCLIFFSGRFGRVESPSRASAQFRFGDEPFSERGQYR